tara:strand:- start:1858 stop:6387 length:4530 start_codon:yes stop_codon:yes gene_type:complete
MSVRRTASIGDIRNEKLLYKRAHEHDACGMGFVASIDGKKSHKIVQLAIEGVVNLTHRGAVSADSKSGDGAGITIQIPSLLLKKEMDSLKDFDEGDFGVAMCFMPSDDADLKQAKDIFEQAINDTDLKLIAWRVVPVNEDVLGGTAKDSAPKILQAIIEKNLSIIQGAAFDRSLYLARKRAESNYKKKNINAYIVSMSARTVVYKGLMVADQLQEFYLDLKDENTQSSTALLHQRFATNTLPNWELAQPFRVVAHNGEFNTLLGNRNWMHAREQAMTSAIWKDSIKDLLPIIQPIGSDTASFDEAFELLAYSGRSLMHSLMMLIPEAWENMPNLNPALHAFYEYHACLTEPWDGPAAVVATNGTVTTAIMDRNGLRPARYQVTNDGVVIVASEVGLIDIGLENVVESGRLGPGQMIAVDNVRKKFLHNDEIKSEVASRKPYANWIKENLIHLSDFNEAFDSSEDSSEFSLDQLKIIFGYSREEIDTVIKPMSESAKEAVGSMGDDTPLSTLQDDPRFLYSYFKQKFAQVTNPAIDSIREEIVMSLDTYLGPRRSILESNPEAAKLIHLNSPLLTNNELAQLESLNKENFKISRLRAVTSNDVDKTTLVKSIDQLCTEAIEAVHNGTSVLIISDKIFKKNEAPIPMILAIAAVHHHLIAMNLRMNVSLVAEAGDARDVHHFSALIGFGASAVNPYLVFRILDDLVNNDSFEDIDLASVLRNYNQAVDTGILKIMSKMGISTVAAYHGGQIFEIIGLANEVTDKILSGTSHSNIDGISFDDIASDIAYKASSAFLEDAKINAGGWYKFRRDGDYHAYNPQVWRALQRAAQNGYDEYKEFTDLAYARPPTKLRDLLAFHSDREPIDIKEVEPTSDIVRRFQTGAMSLGALSPEAHEDLARGMNILGGRSNTGEGGEDAQRYLPNGTKKDANSQVKQVASGRFGVTPSYLVAANELEIKISQGSKPGEGGQLPGFKVDKYIAELRHVMPGTPLISPPPHHDIYSIEDIAQLIYDLKMINPNAKVCVKLVAAEGVGTIAAGVAKGYADVIQISGADGGTGASPLSSIKYAGSPFELGLAETQQVLVMNDLRGRVTLRTDGGMHTGKDIVVAAMLGADQYGFGTSALIALGCKMARQCHLNTCPVGIATQRDDLREKYIGTPEMLVNYLNYIAMEVREILASLGYKSINDIIGRADLLQQVSEYEADRYRNVDLSKMITAIDPEHTLPHSVQLEKNERPNNIILDDKILDKIQENIDAAKPSQETYEINNTNRTVGARVSGYISKKYGDAGLPYGTVDLTFNGSAGQSFGAFLSIGMRLTLIGEANDYVAKGMRGGEIVIMPVENSNELYPPVLAGNTVLYGATGGNLFVRGHVGERFAVRNSGARAVVEGIGDHGCEYMTDGVVVILGETGRNFGAGMSNGMAFVLDEKGDFRTRINEELVGLEQIGSEEDIELLKELIQRHAGFTNSEIAKNILSDWQTYLPKFWKVAPKFAATEDGAMVIARKHLKKLHRMH